MIVMAYMFPRCEQHKNSIEFVKRITCKHWADSKQKYLKYFN